MTLQEFIAMVPRFSGLSHPEKIKQLGWFLHVHEKQERFTQGAIKKCYDQAHVQAPNLSKEFTRLLERSPRQLLRDRDGFRLELKVRQALDQLYGEQQTTIVASSLLKELPGRIADDAERLFLSEALKCYRATAFRATIVMVWNLAYDHLLRWVLKDASRLSAFNSKILARIGAKRGAGLVIATREDFELLTEKEVVDICGTASLFASDNTKKVLDIQLTKRNMAAHPSLNEIGEPQANDAVSDLITNVVLKLV